MLQIFAIIDDTSVMNFRKKLQHNFPKMRGVKGRLELFRKFIRFGRGMLPYWVTVFAKVNVYLRISKNIITTVKWRTFTGKLIAIAKRRSIQPNNGQFRIAKFSQMVQVDCC